MTTTPRPPRPGEHPVLGIAAHEPAFAAVAARQRRLLDDAVTRRRLTCGREPAVPHVPGRRWPWLLLLRSLNRRPCPGATP